MTAPLVLIDRTHPHVTILTLNRPDKRNALNIEMMEQFCQALEATIALPDQRVIILTGAGTSFCTGMDLKEASNPAKIDQSAQLIARMLTSLYQSKLVTIAAVQGAAIAGGAGLMSACDFVVAAVGTRFGYPETRRGLVAAQVATLLLRQLRIRDMRELLLFGELVGTDRALEMGLINRVVPSDELLTQALAFAEVVLQGAPEATAETKRLIDALDPRTLTEDLKVAMRFHHQARESKEAKEGIDAFFEERKPSWVAE